MGGKKEFDEYVSGITRQRIASICLALGWNSVHQSSMEIMQDLMIRYIRMLGVGAQARAELCNRTQSNVMDLQNLFDDININLGELEEYIEKVDDRALVTGKVMSSSISLLCILNLRRDLDSKNFSIQQATR